MQFALDVVLDFISKIGGIGEQDLLLTHPQFITYNCLNTIAEIEKYSLKPTLNKETRPFIYRRPSFEQNPQTVVITNEQNREVD